MKSNKPAILDPHRVLLVSVDFETLGLDANTVIIGLGAVIETPLREDKAIRRRRWKVSHFPISATNQPGRLIDAETTTWWRTQRDNALRLGWEAAMVGNAKAVKAAIADLFKQVENALAYSFPNAKFGTSECPGVYWVFKPAMFDGAILRSICMYLGPEWVDKLDALSGGVYRRRCLDMNTLKFALEMMGIEPPEVPQPGQIHHPLADAIAQMEGVKLYLARLRCGYGGFSGEFADQGTNRQHGQYLVRQEAAQTAGLELADLTVQEPDADDQEDEISADLADNDPNAPDIDDSAVGEPADPEDEVLSGTATTVAEVAQELTDAVEIEERARKLAEHVEVHVTRVIDPEQDDLLEDEEEAFNLATIVEEGRKVLTTPPPIQELVGARSDGVHVSHAGFSDLVSSAMAAKRATAQTLTDLLTACKTDLNRRQLAMFDPREQTLSQRAQEELVPLLRKLAGVEPFDWDAHHRKIAIELETNGFA